jgi:hypothetical protein
VIRKDRREAQIRIRDDDQADVAVHKRVIDINAPRPDEKLVKFDGKNIFRRHVREIRELEPCREYLYVGCFINRGPGNLWGEDYYVRDRLSPKVNFIEASPGGEYDPENHTVTWKFNYSIKSKWDTGQKRNGWIRFSVKEEIQQGEIIINNLGVKLPDYFRFPKHKHFRADPNPKNNLFRHRIHYTIDQTQIKGIIFCDANSNGVQDAVEPGISNVVVYLYNKVDPQPVKVPKELTDADGYFQFRNLAAGDYVAQIDETTLPDGANSTTGGNSQDVTAILCDCQTINFGFDNLDCSESFVGGKGAELTVCTDEKGPNDLSFIQGTQSFGGDDYSWCNAVDGDYEGWDGTTMARGNENPADPASAIFQFGDGGKYKFNYIAFQTDNGTADDGEKYDYQTLSLEVLVSTTGKEDVDFTSVGVFNRNGDGTELEWHKLQDYVEATFVKLELLTPNFYTGNWRQIVEFEVHDGATKQGASPASTNKFDLAALPETTQMFHAYPNPFNPQTTIEYDLEMDSNVSIHIYDLNGRQVATLIDNQQLAGHHQVIWNATSFASGTYLVIFNTGQHVQSDKIILLK